MQNHAKDCKHMDLEIVYSPNDKFYYGECRKCWHIGPDANNESDARNKFFEAAKNGELE